MKKLISVDIQPLYTKWINFSIRKFCSFLEDYDSVLYLFNGPETVDGDSKGDIIDWLLENGLDKEEVFKINFLDKGYGFFRGWMDQGLDNDTIENVFRYMLDNDVRDSRDIEEEDIGDLIERFPDLEDIDLDEPIHLPEFNLDVLNKYNRSHLVGGQENDCLAEFIILLKSLDIKFKIINKFVY